MGKRKKIKFKSSNKPQSPPPIKRLLEKIFFPIKREFSQKWLFYLVLLIALPTIFFFMKGELQCPDGIGYFVYTRSLAIDQDLFFANDLKLIGVSSDYEYFHPIPQTNYISNVFAMGTGLAWIPFFIIGHLVVTIFELFLNSLPLSSEGTSYYHVLACSLGSCLLGLFSLLISFKVSRRFFSAKDSLLAIIGIWFASPFVFCFYWMPTHSHLVDAFATAFFLLMWIESNDKKGWLWWLCFGLSFGFAVLVRWQNILLGILLLVPLKITPKLLSFALGSFLVFSPQIVAWKLIYGEFFLIPQGEGFMRWSHPEILKFLFSSWHGLYSWTPILILSTIGLFLLYQKDRRMAIGFLLVFLIQVYVNACVSDWWAGTSFGARRMIGFTPIFIIGLASFFSLFSGRKRVAKYFIVALTTFFAFILTVSMLNSPDYFTEYRSYPELIRINLATISSLKDLAPRLISLSPLAKLNLAKLVSQTHKLLYFTLAIKLIYIIFGMLFFFFLRIGYELIIKKDQLEQKK